VRLRQGILIERVHNSKFVTSEFNPCEGNPTRFAPVHDSSGACVPSLYAGESFEVAVFETIFHDVIASVRRKKVPQKKVNDCSQGRLEVLRDLKLVSLREPGLKAWRINRNQLISSSPKLYAETAEWAEAIHHQFSDAEGLEWTSNQCDPASSYLFFGDRVDSSDFKLVYSRVGATDPGFRKEIKDIGKRAGIGITI